VAVVQHVPGVARRRRGRRPANNPGLAATVLADLLGTLVPPVADGIINDDAPTAALHPLMDARPGDVLVSKPRFGSFHGTDLEVILRSGGMDTLILGGINSNVCVDTTAREAAVREFKVLFLSDGTANFDLPDGGLGPASAEELQRTACAVMAFGFAEVVTVDQVLGRITVTASA